MVDVAPGGLAAALAAPDNPALIAIGMIGGYLLGAAACFATEHHQRLGDLVAGTVVVSYARDDTVYYQSVTGAGAETVAARTGVTYIGNV